MSSFIEFLSRTTLSFTFSFGDVFGLIIIFYGLWTWYLGAKLYAAYAADNAAASFETWAKTRTGKAFLKALIFPFVPLILLIGIISLPIVWMWQIVEKWLSSHSK